MAAFSLKTFRLFLYNSHNNFFWSVVSKKFQNSDQPNWPLAQWPWWMVEQAENPQLFYYK